MTLGQVLRGSGCYYMAFSRGILTVSSRNEIVRTTPVCTTGNTTANDRKHTVGSGSLVVALVVTAPHPCPLHNNANDIAQIVRGLDVHVLIIESAQRPATLFILMQLPENQAFGGIIGVGPVIS